MVPHFVNAVMVSPGAYLLVLPSVSLRMDSRGSNSGSVVVRIGRAWLCFYLAYIILEVNLSCLKVRVK